MGAKVKNLEDKLKRAEAIANKDTKKSNAAADKKETDFKKIEETKKQLEEEAEASKDGQAARDKMAKKVAQGKISAAVKNAANKEKNARALAEISTTQIGMLR